MNKIRVLPDHLANQIAAGEVVERPASVVKELVENAIDAGADRLKIEIELGGRRLIRVNDNGSGLVRDDAVLAFERHATSKIRTLEDLSMIGTLGFRGEALASIASVAKVSLTSKTEAETAATAVLIEGGRLIDVKDAGRDTGTTISVRDLFFNTPARRKFMRSEATENYHIASIVTHYALAHPEIAFDLINNGREVLTASPARNLRERAFQIFGAGLLDSLVPVAGGREFVAKVSGFVSAPRERRTNRDSQYFFVNSRYVRDKTIASGLAEGFRSVLPHGVYPVAFLFVDVPVEEIDVNVHPAKTEIRFRRSEAVKDVIAEAIRSSLAQAGVVAQEPDTISETAAFEPAELKAEPGRFAETDESARSQGMLDLPQVPESFTARAVGAGAGPAADTEAAMPAPDPGPAGGEVTFEHDFSAEFEQAAEKRTEPYVRELSAEPIAQELGVIPPLNSAAPLVREGSVDEVSRSRIRPIDQLHESFIIAVDDEGLLLIDQHVAHERILFDKFRTKESERPIESQNLLLPETLDLTPAQAEVFQMIEDDLAGLGFGLMRLSGRTVAIKSIPTDLPPAEARNLLAEILDSIESDKRRGAKAVFRDSIAASLACKAAVKINMKLTPEKMQWLIDGLLQTSSPTTCPHGRPVILRLTMKDIEKGFHRS
ncbi:MAG: DNA mismatch repair endonuclease MutL [Pyrinomonadaceae bacterium]